MAGDVQLENGAYGRRAVIRTSWTPGLSAQLKRQDVVELELNQGRGWRGDDVAFLADLPELKALDILDLTIKDIGPIHALPNLRHLGVTTYCLTEIRFSEFQHLEECALEWRPKAKSLFECISLKKLFVNRYAGQDAEPFARLTRLESLSILNSPLRTLEALRALRNLRFLRLGGLRRLASLAGVEDLVNLETLQVHTCRAIRRVGELGHLSKLRELHLDNDGDISSLRPLDALDALESVSFYESTNIVDGDLSPLLRQKALRRVSFKNRRHYSHRREDFGVAS